MSREPDSRLAVFAARRLAVVTPDDAVACGMSRRTFYRRCDEGLYLPVHHNVYRSVAVPWTPRGELLAAVTAAGPEAVACGVSALAAWGLGDRPLTAPYHVASPQRIHREPEGVRVHEFGWLTDEDRTHLGPIPITAVPASIASGAGDLTGEEVEEAVIEAQRRWRRTTAALGALVPRLPTNLPGRGDLRRTLDRFDPEAASALLSRLEAKGLAFVRRAGLPTPAVNRRLYAPDGRLIAKLDFDWMPPGVPLEWDGLRYHSSPRQKRNDDARQNQVGLTGRLVLRYGWADLRDEPERIAAELRRAFAMKGAPLA
jgi:hypothetical protein